MRTAILMTACLAIAQADQPVTAEFRVFSGVHEITADTRLRVMPTGERDKATPLESSLSAGFRARRVTTALPPGIYDVQALRVRKDAVVAIKWTERLVVMHYPDEGGRHLEVINFEPGYGALQLRAAQGPVTEYEVAVFPSGDRAAAAGVPVDGEDYRLFILPAGIYDIRVRHTGRDPQDTRWFLDVEVPADRTRLKQIDGS